MWGFYCSWCFYSWLWWWFLNWVLWLCEFVVIEWIWCFVIIDLICDNRDVRFHFQVVFFDFLICKFELSMELRIQEARNGLLRFRYGFCQWCKEVVADKGFCYGCDCTVDGFAFGLGGWPWRFLWSGTRFKIFHKLIVRL